jgi:hypothetical protein
MIWAGLLRPDSRPRAEELAEWGDAPPRVRHPDPEAQSGAAPDPDPGGTARVGPARPEWNISTLLEWH